MSKYCFVCCSTGRFFSVDLSTFKRKDHHVSWLSDYDFSFVEFIEVKRELRIYDDNEVNDLRARAVFLKEHNPRLFMKVFPHFGGHFYQTANEHKKEKRRVLYEYKLPCSHDNYVCDICYYGNRIVEKLNLCEAEKIKVLGDPRRKRFSFKFENKTRLLSGNLPVNFNRKERRMTKRGSEQWKLIKNAYEDFHDFINARYEDTHSHSVDIFSYPLQKSCNIGGQFEIDDEMKGLSLEVRMALRTRKYNKVERIFRKCSRANLVNINEINDLKHDLDVQYTRENIRYNFLRKGKKRFYILRVNDLNILKAICLNKVLFRDICKNVVDLCDYVSNRRALVYHRLKDSQNYNFPDIVNYYEIQELKSPTNLNGRMVEHVSWLSTHVGHTMDETILSGSYLAQIGRITAIDTSSPQDDNSCITNFHLLYPSKDELKPTPEEFRTLLGNEAYGSNLLYLESQLFPVIMENEVAKRVFKKNFNHEVLVFVNFKTGIKNDEAGNKENHFDCSNKNKKGIIQESFEIDERSNDRYKLITSKCDEERDYDNLDINELERLIHLLKYRDFIIFGGQEPLPLYREGSLERTIYSGLKPCRVLIDILVHQIKAMGRPISKLLHRFEDFARKFIRTRYSKNILSESITDIKGIWKLVEKSLYYESSKSGIATSSSSSSPSYSRKKYHKNKRRIENIDGVRGKALIGMFKPSEDKTKFPNYCLELSAAVKSVHDSLDSSDIIDENALNFACDLFEVLIFHIDNEREIFNILKSFPYVTDDILFMILPKRLVLSTCFWFVFSKPIKSLTRYLAKRNYCVGSWMKLAINGKQKGDGMESTERRNSGDSGSKESWESSTKCRRTGKERDLGRIKHINWETTRKSIRNNNLIDTTYGMIVKENMLVECVKPIYFDPSHIREQKSFNIKDFGKSDELTDEFTEEIVEFVSRVSKENWVKEVDDDYLKELQKKMNSIEHFEREEIEKKLKEWIAFGEKLKFFEEKYQKTIKKLSWKGPLDEEILKRGRVEQLEFIDGVRKQERWARRQLSDEDDDDVVVLSKAFFGATGIGKTWAGCVIVATFLDEVDRGITLIVGPGNTLKNWEAELRGLWDDTGSQTHFILNLYDENLSTKKCLKQIKKVFNRGGVLLANTELIRSSYRSHSNYLGETTIIAKVYEKVYEIVFELVERLQQIFDEAHDTVSGGKMPEILMKTKSLRKFVLTASPCTDDGISLFNLLKYCFGHLTQFKDTIIGLDKLAEQLRKRRLKEKKGDVFGIYEEAQKLISPFKEYIFKKLKPMKIFFNGRELFYKRIIIKSNLSDSQQKEIKKIENSRKSDMIKIKKIQKFLITSKKVDVDDEEFEVSIDDLDSSRMNIVVEVAKSLVKKGVKMIIWAQRVKTIKLVFHLLCSLVEDIETEKESAEKEEEEEEMEGEDLDSEEPKIDPDIHYSNRVAKLHGSVGKKKRKKIEALAKNTKGYFFLVCSSLLCKTGSNFQWGTVSASLENYWRYDEDMQEENRTFRYGQKGDCLGMKFFSTAAESRMFLTMLGKKVGQDAMLDDDFDIQRFRNDFLSITHEEIEDFFTENNIVGENKGKESDIIHDILIDGVFNPEMRQEYSSVVNRSDLEDFILRRGRDENEIDDKQANTDEEEDGDDHNIPHTENPDMEERDLVSPNQNLDEEEDIDGFVLPNSDDEEDVDDIASPDQNSDNVKEEEEDEHRPDQEEQKEKFSIGRNVWNRFIPSNLGYHGSSPSNRKKLHRRKEVIDHCESDFYPKGRHVHCSSYFISSFDVDVEVEFSEEDFLALMEFCRNGVNIWDKTCVWGNFADIHNFEGSESNDGDD